MCLVSRHTLAVKMGSRFIVYSLYIEVEIFFILIKFSSVVALKVDIFWASSDNNFAKGENLSMSLYCCNIYIYSFNFVIHMHHGVEYSFAMRVILSLLGKPGAIKPRSVKQIALGWRLKTSGYLGPPKGHNMAASIWCLSGSMLMGVNYLVGELLIGSVWYELINRMDVGKQAHSEVHFKKFALSSCCVWFCSILVNLAQCWIIVKWTCRFEWDFRWVIFQAYITQPEWVKNVTSLSNITIGVMPLGFHDNLSVKVWLLLWNPSSRMTLLVLFVLWNGKLVI